MRGPVRSGVAERQSVFIKLPGELCRDVRAGLDLVGILVEGALEVDTVNDPILGVLTAADAQRKRLFFVTLVYGSGNARVQLAAPLGGALDGKHIPRIEPVIAKREVDGPVVGRRTGFRYDFDPATSGPGELGRVGIAVNSYLSYLVNWNAPGGTG